MNTCIYFQYMRFVLSLCFYKTQFTISFSWCVFADLSSLAFGIWLPYYTAGVLPFYSGVCHLKSLVKILVYSQLLLLISASAFLCPGDYGECFFHAASRINKQRSWTLKAFNLLSCFDPITSPLVGNVLVLTVLLVQPKVKDNCLWSGGWDGMCFCSKHPHPRPQAKLWIWCTFQSMC